MINKEKFQRAHGDINVEIDNDDIKRFYQSGSAKVFYHKHNQPIKELVLVNTAGGLQVVITLIKFDIIKNHIHSL